MSCTVISQIHSVVFGLKLYGYDGDLASRGLNDALMRIHGAPISVDLSESTDTTVVLYVLTLNGPGKITVQSTDEDTDHESVSMLADKCVPLSMLDRLRVTLNARRLGFVYDNDKGTLAFEVSESETELHLRAALEFVARDSSEVDASWCFACVVYQEDDDPIICEVINRGTGELRTVDLHPDGICEFTQEHLVRESTFYATKDGVVEVAL